MSRRWIERATGLLSRAFEAIAARKDWDNQAVEADAHTLLANRESLERLLRRLGEGGEGSLMTRIHGDFHLGQVLVASGDAYIIDFEGEPARPLGRAPRQGEPVARRRGPAALASTMRRRRRSTPRT